MQRVWLQIPALSQNTCATSTTSICAHESIFILPRLIYLSVHFTKISHSKVLVKLGKSGLAGKQKKILNLNFTGAKIKVICYQKSRLLLSLLIKSQAIISSLLLKTEMKSYGHMKDEGGQLRQRINRYISGGRFLGK